MTKDYKNVSESRKKADSKTQKPATKTGSGGSLPGWIWLVAGLVIGSFISFLVYLKTNVPTEQTSSVQKEEKPVVKKKEPEKTAEPKEEERFKFYEILPKREVRVPVEEAPETAGKPENLPGEKRITTPEVVTKPTTEERYLYELQAGSYLKFKDADKQKASLAFLGVHAKIQAVKAPDNKTLYRVRIGPYDSIAKINEIEKTLKQNNIKTLLVKTRG